MLTVDPGEYTRNGGGAQRRRGPTDIVTGAAGFIGSHLVDLLVDRGRTVIGLDSLDPAYSPEQKRANLAAASGRPWFRLEVGDLRGSDLAELFAGAETVYHLAARAGVQDSWGGGFSDAWEINVAGTQAVLEAALTAGIRRVVVASSSSVYGDSAGPGGRRILSPISPYGASKAACEHLAGVYGPARARHRDAAVFHGLRPPPASRHGHAPDVRGGPARGPLIREARLGIPDTRVHLRARCRGGHRGGGSAVRRRRPDIRCRRRHPGVAERRDRRGGGPGRPGRSDQHCGPARPEIRWQPRRSARRPIGCWAGDPSLPCTEVWPSSGRGIGAGGLLRRSLRTIPVWSRPLPEHGPYPHRRQHHRPNEREDHRSRVEVAVVGKQHPPGPVHGVRGRLEVGDESPATRGRLHHEPQPVEDPHAAANKREPEQDGMPAHQNKPPPPRPLEALPRAGGRATTSRAW